MCDILKVKFENIEPITIQRIILLFKNINCLEYFKGKTYMIYVKKIYTYCESFSAKKEFGKEELNIKILTTYR